MDSTHLKGLIFDCDGTLADTMPLHWRAWQLVTRRHNLHFPVDRFYSLGGVPSRDILKMLAAEQGRTLDAIAIAHEKEEAYLPMMAEVKPSRPSWKSPAPTSAKSRSPWPPAAPSPSSCRCWNISHPPTLPGRRHQRDDRPPKTRPRHLLGSRPPHRRGPAVLPRLRGHRPGAQAIRAAGMDAVDVRTLIGAETGNQRHKETAQ